MNTYNINTIYRLPHQNNPALKGSYTLFIDDRIKLGWKKLILINCPTRESLALKHLFKHISIPHLPIIIFGGASSIHMPFNQFIFKNGRSARVTTLENNQLLMGSKIYIHDGMSSIRIDCEKNLVLLHDSIHPIPAIQKSAMDTCKETLNNQKDIVTIFSDASAGEFMMLSYKACQHKDARIQTSKTSLSNPSCFTTLKLVPRLCIGSTAEIGKRINELSQIYMCESYGTNRN